LGGEHGRRISVAMGEILPFIEYANANLSVCVADDGRLRRSSEFRENELGKWKGQWSKISRGGWTMEVEEYFERGLDQGKMYTPRWLGLLQSVLKRHLWTRAWELRD